MYLWPTYQRTYPYNAIRSTKGSQDKNMQEFCSFDLLDTAMPPVSQSQRKKKRAADTAGTDAPGVVRRRSAVPSPPFSLLKSFSIRVYQCHAQPGNPIFAPRQVSIELIWMPQADSDTEDKEGGGGKGEGGKGMGGEKEMERKGMTYYRETFQVRQTVHTQSFSLATAQMLFRANTGNTGNAGIKGGNTRVKFSFHGAYQRQTLSVEDIAENVGDLEEGLVDG